MDRTYIDEHHVVDRYVQGKLTGTELEEFEIFMLENPSIVDEVNLSESMQAELQTQMPKPEANSGWKRLAIAASALLALSVSYSSFLLVDDSEVSTQSIRLERVRSQAPVPTLTATRGDTIQIEADVGLNESETYGVVLRSADGSFSLTRRGLAATNGFVTVDVVGAPAGDYEFEIMAGEDLEITTKYQFTIVISES